MIPEKLLTYTKTIFEYSHSTVYIKDKNCHYQYMNNNGLKQLQLQEQDILCMPDSSLPFGKYADFIIAMITTQWKKLFTFNWMIALLKMAKKYLPYLINYRLKMRMEKPMASLALPNL